jgi:hypothetical protein
MGDQTSGMAVMDARLGARGPLARFIAERREPGGSWRSFEAIATELTEVTGISLTGPGVSLWAQRLGIPDSSRKGGPADREAYRVAMERYLRAPRGERTA